MALPNFLIIGASKSGTTALYSVLSQHPDVFMSAFKEPFFFSAYKPSARSVRTLEEYTALFDGATSEARIGEASAGYLYCEEAPRNILRTLGEDVRMIAILRHPVDRAYSMYWHRRRDAEEPLSFEDAVLEEEGRIAEGWQIGWHYLAMGHYKRQLERYEALFGRDRLKVVSFDDFQADPHAVVREVTDFLGVASPEALPRRMKENRSFEIRHPAVERLVQRLGSGGGARLRRAIPAFIKQSAKNGIRRLNRKSMGYAPLDPDLRLELSARFREDIEYLARHVNPSFERWADELA